MFAFILTGDFHHMTLSITKLQFQLPEKENTICNLSISCRERELHSNYSNHKGALPHHSTRVRSINWCVDEYYLIMRSPLSLRAHALTHTRTHSTHTHSLHTHTHSRPRRRSSKSTPRKFAIEILTLSSSLNRLQQCKLPVEYLFKITTSESGFIQYFNVTEVSRKEF